MTTILELSEVVIQPVMRGMCRKPYPNHPHGCPNFNHKAGCPPNTPLFSEVIDLTKPVFAIVNEFDFGAHVAKMKAAHPQWTERQLTCCLYWQTTARKALKAGMQDFQRLHPEYTIDTCPEAKGVNITETLRKAGLELEWPPRNIARQVALAGVAL